MQIKEHPPRSGKFQFLRYEGKRDPVTKKVVRAGQKVIHEADFTEAERAQFEQWKVDRAAAQEKASKASSASVAAWSVTRLAEAVEAGHLPPDPVQLLAALDRLNKALRKAGVKRPARVAAQKPADTRTGNLLP